MRIKNSYPNAAALITDLADRYEKVPDLWIKGVYTGQHDSVYSAFVKNGIREISDSCDPKIDCFCVVGGLRHLTCKMPSSEREDIVHAAKSAIRDIIRTPDRSVEEWNDAKGRTLDQIIAGLRDAAELAADA